MHSKIEARNTLVFLASACLAIRSSLALGQPASDRTPTPPSTAAGKGSFAPNPRSQNAAERYAALFPQIDKHLFQLAHSVEDDFTKLTLAPGSPENGASELKASLARSHEWLAQVVAATKLDRCEFGLTEDPHFKDFPKDDPRHDYLSHLRQIWRILRADAISLWISGERNEAVERVAAMMRLTAQLTSERSPFIDHFLISAEMSEGLALIRSLHHIGLTETQRDVLFKSISGLKSDDPAGERAAWLSHSVIMEQFIRKGLEGGRVSPALRQDLTESRAMLVMEDARRNLPPKDLLAPKAQRAMRDAIDALPPLTHDGIATALDRAARLRQDADRAWKGSDGLERLKAIVAETSIAHDNTGVALIVVGLPDKEYEQWLRLTDDLRDTRATLAPQGQGR
jgi:hypothetical protein